MIYLGNLAMINTVKELYHVCSGFVFVVLEKKEIGKEFDFIHRQILSGSLTRMQ